jgi:hypothetical protein
MDDGRDQRDIAQQQRQAEAAAEARQHEPVHQPPSGGKVTEDRPRQGGTPQHGSQ